MDCLNDNCTITGNERMISCWLRLSNYHLKCTALRARDADALLDPVKSLHWTCSACMKINIDFYKFFKSYKGEFEKLNTDFESLQSKLASFGELFKNCSFLDKFVKTGDKISPKRIIKSYKLLEVPSLSNESSPTVTNSVTINNSTSSIPSMSSDKTSLPIVTNSVTVNDSISTPSTSSNAVYPRQANRIGSASEKIMDNIQTTDTQIFKHLQAVHC